MNIAQITDLHIDNDDNRFSHINNRANFLAVLEDIKHQGIDEIIITGDITEQSGLDWFLERMRQNEVEYKLVLGNHDKHCIYESIHSSMAHFPYYSTYYQGFHCLFLDSSEGMISREQFIWIERILNDHNMPIIVFIHHPILKCTNNFMENNHSLKRREQLENILIKLQREVVIFCGHYHSEETTVFKNITQYVTPSTFFQFDKTSSELEIASEKIGYRLISINNNEYATRVRYL